MKNKNQIVGFLYHEREERSVMQCKYLYMAENGIPSSNGNPMGMGIRLQFGNG